MTDGEHPSDDPGRRERSRQQQPRHPHSGSGASSPPRRPGTGERQAPRRHHTGDAYPQEPLVPGEILYGDEPVVINADVDVVSLLVQNTADRPIQVGSHYHFAEVNRRSSSIGRRRGAGG